MKKHIVTLILFAGIAAALARMRVDHADVIETGGPIVDRGKADQGLLLRPPLHENGSLIREIAREIGTRPDELSPGAIQGDEAFGDRSVLHAVDDA